VKRWRSRKEVQRSGWCIARESKKGSVYAVERVDKERKKKGGSTGKGTMDKKSSVQGKAIGRLKGGGGRFKKSRWRGKRGCERNWPGEKLEVSSKGCK